MFNFFKSVLNTISVLVTFLVSLVEGLISFLVTLAKGSAYLGTTIALLPAPIVGAALTIVGAAVVFKILNR
ncbi:MAG: hypothetical protein HFI38_13995 [Lachnospiraceae bacterium]|jgi:hypothetical protein|nr:hypothetical protein [Lachnospiraceae bacterium]